MKERKNRAPARHNRLIVERGYFHTGNSGISISMIEEVENQDWDEQDRDWYDHHLEVRHSAFGAGSTFRTPIAGPAMCDYYIEAFTRLRDRMVADPNYRIPHPFDRYGHEDVATGGLQKKNKQSESHRIVDIANGLLREEVWSPDTVCSVWSSEERLLGHNYVEQDTAKVVHYVPFGGRVVRGSACSGGGEPPYREQDIGKTVEQAKADQIADAEQAKLDTELNVIRKFAGITKGTLTEEERNTMNYDSFHKVDREAQAVECAEADEQTLEEALKKQKARQVEDALPRRILKPKTAEQIETDAIKTQEWLDEQRNGGLQEEINEAIEALEESLEESDLLESATFKVNLKTIAIFETDTAPLLVEQRLKAIQWIDQHDEFAEVFYDDKWHPANSQHLTASIIADAMIEPDAKLPLLVKFTTDKRRKEFHTALRTI